MFPVKADRLESVKLGDTLKDTQCVLHTDFVFRKTRLKRVKPPWEWPQGATDILWQNPDRDLLESLSRGTTNTQILMSSDKAYFLES